MSQADTKVQMELNFASDHNENYDAASQQNLESWLAFTIMDFLELEKHFGHVFMMRELSDARSRRLQRT